MQYTLQSYTKRIKLGRQRGINEVWLNGKMTDIPPPAQGWGKDDRFSHQFSQVQDILRDALNQAARELLLAQSSDWPSS